MNHSGKLLLAITLLLLSFASAPAQSYTGDRAEIDTILQNIESFSRFYMNKEYEKLAGAYTVDGKILPPGTDIIEGREAIQRRWTLPEGVNVLHHEINPAEIKIVGDYAYDVGYYEGRTERPDGNVYPFKGKYVIVWKKVEGDWKIYLDIWNDIR